MVPLLKMVSLYLFILDYLYCLTILFLFISHDFSCRKKMTGK